MSDTKKLADQLKDFVERSHSEANRPIGMADAVMISQAADALRAASAETSSTSDPSIEELAKIIDYRAYFEWDVFRDQMIAEGKDETTAKKMADYHWLRDKKIARVKAGQILDRIRPRSPAATASLSDQIEDTLCGGNCHHPEVCDGTETTWCVQKADEIAKMVSSRRSQPECVSEFALTEWFKRNASDDQPSHLIAQAFAHDFDVRRK